MVILRIGLLLLISFLFAAFSRSRVLDVVIIIIIIIISFARVLLAMPCCVSYALVRDVSCSFSNERVSAETKPLYGIQNKTKLNHALTTVCRAYAPKLPPEAMVMLSSTTTR
jgi:hypothetical protein